MTFNEDNYRNKQLNKYLDAQDAGSQLIDEAYEEIENALMGELIDGIDKESLLIEVQPLLHNFNRYNNCDIWEEDIMKSLCEVWNVKELR